MLEHLKGEVIHHRFGPYSAELPGPFGLDLFLDGEIVVKANVENGFLYRGVEKAIQSRGIKSIIPYVDHIDPEGAVFYEHALCLSAEKIAKLTVPKRAEQIRIVISELTRISQHLSYLGRVARSVGGDTLFHYVYRDRERILDLFELLTGARFSLNFFCLGGVRGDVSDGFIERVLEVCELIQIRPKEYNDLFTFSWGFIKRAGGAGEIRKDVAARFGLSGPNRRACGESRDVRKQNPYSGYQEYDFEVPTGKGDFGLVGDAHDRFLVRLREIGQSIEIIRQVLDQLAQTPFVDSEASKLESLPRGEAYFSVEGARGEVGCFLVADGSSMIARSQFNTPSQRVMQFLPYHLVGQRFEDIPFLIASLDLCPSEVDR